MSSITDASVVSLSVSPTLLVGLTRGKLIAFHQALRERNISDTFTCEPPSSLEYHLYYLDLFQIARVSREIVLLLQQWRCTLLWGCRIDGPVDTEEFGGLAYKLRLDHGGTWWPRRQYQVFPKSASFIYDQLRQAGAFCTLVNEDPKDEFVSQLIKTWKQPPLLQPEMAFDAPGEALPLTWSPDSKRLLYTRRKQYVYAGDRKIWEDCLLIANRKHGKELAWMSFRWLYEREGHLELSGCAWSHDGRFLALAFVNETLVIRVHGFEILLVIPATGCFGTEFAWSPDSKRLALSCLVEDDPDFPDNDAVTQVQVWDIQKKALLQTYKGHNGPTWAYEVRSLCWSADGARLASAGTDHSVHVWDVRTGERQMLYEGHTGRVTTVCFAPTGELVASTSYDGWLLVWDVGKGESVFAARIDEPSAFHGWYHERRVTWSPDGRSIVFQNDRQELVRFHLSTRQTTCLYSLDPYTLQDIAWSPDGSCLAISVQDFTHWEEEGEHVFLWPLDSLLSLWLL